MFSLNAKVAENSEKSIKPAASGSRRCFCRGEVLTVLTNCCWLMVYGDDDRPSDEKNAGNVYVHKDEVVGDKMPCPGDIVTFYLYSDDAGLGAEECRVEEATGHQIKANVSEIDQKSMDLMPESDTVPWAMLLKRMSGVFKDITLDDNDEWYGDADADDVWQVSDGPSLDAGQSGYDEKESDWEDFEEVAALGKGLSRLFHNMTLDTDDEEEEFAILKQEPSSVLNETSIGDVHFDVMDVGKPWHVEGALSDGSTSDGATSESDSESMSETASITTVGKPWHVKRAPSDGSTCDGTASESEQDTASEELSDSEIETASNEKDSLLPSISHTPRVLSLPPWRTKRNLINNEGSAVDLASTDSRYGKLLCNSDEDCVPVQSSLFAGKPLPPNFRPPPGLSLPPWRTVN